MYNKISKAFFTVLSIVFLYATMADAGDKTLYLVSSSGLNTIEGAVGDSITVEVRIDDASVVAGASFTIKYDTANLSLTSVESNFFDTFANQNIPTPNNQGYVTVDSEKYYSPVIGMTVSELAPPITTGTMLAAARTDNGNGTDVTLFTLQFELIGAPGTYPIMISQSIISNEAAGYSAAGEAIPYLVGIADSSYPTYGPGYDYGLTSNGCTVTVSGDDFVDIDNDGIDDNWEIENRPDGVAADALNVLTYFTAYGDYDNDGYTDRQEYLNYIKADRDPNGGSYDPKVKNVPYGTGYAAADFLPAIYPMLF